MTDTLDKLKAAREAFHAYEKAVEAAQEVIAAGPPRGPGTTVMTGQALSSFSATIDIKYNCAECGERRAMKGDKFCAHCGREIVRFVTEPASNTITVKVESVKTESPTPSYFQMDAPPQESAPKAQRRKRAS
jgi:hypothetical protein